MALGEFNAIVRFLMNMGGEKEIAPPTEAEFDAAIADLEARGLK